MRSYPLPPPDADKTFPCQLREPETPPLVPFARDIPAVPTALGALDAAERAEFWAALALTHTHGLGPRSRKRLLDVFGSALGAVRGVARWAEAGIREAAIREFRSEAWRESAKKEWEAARRLTGSLLLWTDDRYPRLLRELPDAPVRLYCRGDLSLLGNPCVSIVGTRLCSREGVRAAQTIASGLAASGITVVSGLAVGIDKQAHLAALPLPGGTIAVLGAGPDVCYPKENNALREAIIEKGLLVSEYAPGTLPDSRHFPIRNRIISGLSLGVVVVEAALRSGSLITARLALEQNRSVYAVPGLIDAKRAEGCRKLIRDGAQPIFSFTDILEDLRPQLQGRVPRGPETAPPVAPLSPAPAGPAPERGQPLPASPTTPAPSPAGPLESRLLTLLAQSPLSVDEACRALGCPSGEAGSLLIILEVRGLIRQRPDLRYTLA
ncbi:MAG TPA: DNA-processing protein DprA [Candidatus Bilophila faecipullorum]|uniref:DNA-processing protein DprA n=5 Tax=Bilophila TaxID=35832 RepID=A0A9D1R0K3_9BACT|nr:DNA-processing protein DprA [uncultured Bilophila sp.]HIW79054.1 DNA-processing protein DprA [Candidatus Bilophila faecipullorum]